MLFRSAPRKAVSNSTGRRSSVGVTPTIVHSISRSPTATGHSILPLPPHARQATGMGPSPFRAWTQIRPAAQHVGQKPASGTRVGGLIGVAAGGSSVGNCLCCRQTTQVPVDVITPAPRMGRELRFAPTRRVGVPQGAPTRRLVNREVAGEGSPRGYSWRSAANARRQPEARQRRPRQTHIVSASLTSLMRASRRTRMRGAPGECQPTIGLVAFRKQAVATGSDERGRNQENDPK